MLFLQDDFDDDEPPPLNSIPDQVRALSLDKGGEHASVRTAVVTAKDGGKPLDKAKDLKPATGGFKR